jgi:hypothetical protein
VKEIRRQTVTHKRFKRLVDQWIDLSIGHSRLTMRTTPPSRRVLLALPMPWLVLGAKERLHQRQVNVNQTIELPGADRWNAETRLHVGTWWRVYRGGLIGYEARKRTSAESIRGGPGELRGS